MKSISRGKPIWPRRLRAGGWVGALAAAVTVHASFATEVTGSGSTFALPIIAKWAADYAASGAGHVTYEGTGSGAGIAQIKSGTVDFAATDKPLPPEELAQAGLGQFPLVIGGVVPIVNIADMRAGELKFSGTLLANIYLGKVTQWRDPAIKALNPRASLPDAAITVVHRSDSSGTTFNWSNYLSKVSPQWKTTVGEGTSVAWPVGVGGKGNEGVADNVNRIPDSIGYVEYAYVVHNNMTYGLMQNRAGKFVAPGIPSFEAASATADWRHSRDFFLIITDAPGPDAYPVTAAVFILMYKQPKDAGRGTATFKFMKWVLEHGQDAARSLDYVPLAPPLVDQIEGYWAATFRQ